MLYHTVFRHLLVFDRTIICCVCHSPNVVENGQMVGKYVSRVCYGGKWIQWGNVSGWCSSVVDVGHILCVLLLYFTICWCLIGLLFVLLLICVL